MAHIKSSNWPCWGQGSVYRKDKHYLFQQPENPIVLDSPNLWNYLIAGWIFLTFLLWIQYAKAGSSLPNNVMKKTLDNCTLRAAGCLLSPPDWSQVCMSQPYFLTWEYFPITSEWNHPKKVSWQLVTLSSLRKLQQYRSQKKHKKSDTKAWENLLNIL